MPTRVFIAMRGYVVGRVERWVFGWDDSIEMKKWEEEVDER